MEAFLMSTAAVATGAVGDKTPLRALMLHGVAAALFVTIGSLALLNVGHVFG